MERYGRDEVANWYWETWNEPNIGYWQGKPEEFFRLHDCAVDAVRRALPEAKVGGPDSAGGGTKFLRDFLEHCVHGTNFATGRTGTPVDFISFHAKGSPVFTNAHVRMGIANQLRDMDSAFKIIASFPELKNKPMIIGESDPDGCAACQGDQLGYRNGAIYASYTAATLARAVQLAGREGVNLEGALTWAFEFEDQPLFAGFRVLACGGVDLPVLNVFRMLSQMSGRRLQLKVTAKCHWRPWCKVASAAARMSPHWPVSTKIVCRFWCGIITMMMCPGPMRTWNMTLAGLPPNVRQAHCEQFRIDARHSNAFTVWQSLGSPAQLTVNQSEEIEKAGHLTRLGPPESLDITSGQAHLQLRLPRQSVSLLRVQWNR